MADSIFAVPTWVRGALICLFGSTLTALGLVLQKHAHAVISRNLGEKEQHRSNFLYLKSKWWVCGFLVFLAAQLINMVSMAMTPQMILSCLGSWTLVCNVVFARLILRESVSSVQASAVAGLVVATALVLYNAPRLSTDQESNSRPVQDISSRFFDPEFDALTSGLCIVALLTRGMAVASAREGAKGKTRLLPASLALAAAVAAGYTALLFKCLAEIIASTASNSPSTPPWDLWQTYAILGAAISCAPVELHCLNLALQSGEAVTVVPVYLALSMLAQMSTGAVFFREFDGFVSPLHAISFFSSVLLTLGLVVVVARAKVASEDESHDPLLHSESLGSSIEPLQTSPACSEPPSPRREETGEVKTPNWLWVSDVMVKRTQSKLKRLFQAQHEPEVAANVAGFAGAIEILDKTKTKNQQRRLKAWQRASRICSSSF